MTAVLTNDDLLRFRVSGGTSSLEFAIAFPLKCVLTGHIGVTDGKIGALIFDGEYFVTTPNQTFIPKPLVGDCKVVMCADSLYADDDCKSADSRQY